MLNRARKILLAIDNRLERFDKKFSTKYKVVFVCVVFVGLVGLAAFFIHGHTIAIFSPKGIIAHKQRNLLVFGSLLSLLVIVPVFAMTLTFVLRYRESNTKATYTPDWDHSRLAETIWWGGPLLLILILSVVAWNSAHTLDPFKPLDSTTKPLTIQVVALQWKWLFIYPDQDIATVNYVQFPEKTPVNFEITSDAPMNSFWIPQLGGQIYAMSGMSTHLHLMADGVDEYKGVSANISGEGFSGMKFVARSTTTADFATWVGAMKHSPNTQLSTDSYQELAEPSLNNPPTDYSLATDDLYNTIVMKYMDPAHHNSASEHTHSHIDYEEHP